VAKVYIVTFRSNDDRRPSKFIVLADNMKSAINMAWEHGGADFQSRFDKSTAQAQEMKEGRCGFCDSGVLRYIPFRREGEARKSRAKTDSPALHFSGVI
jgi:hypothetical protein